ncbi:hypothetical protein A2U01_0014634 [Trifolium medium]|uniref:DUF7745 domain-containing protein n=1 Tax=Trifolium medium TaxID=97028 RepID=A0A392N290_9FABA|nr:hypothetical protein [Trifolium medium]
MCKVKVMNKHEWGQLLVDLNEKKVRWCPGWRQIHEVIYRRGKYPYVLLMGTKELRRNCQAWDRVIIKKGQELGKRSCGANNVYRNWLEKRVENIKFPYQSSIVEEEPEPNPITAEEVEKIQEMLSKEHEEEKLKTELKVVRKV